MQMSQKDKVITIPSTLLPINSIKLTTDIVILSHTNLTLKKPSFKIQLSNLKYTRHINNEYKFLSYQ